MFKKIVLGLFLCGNVLAYTIINDRDGDTLDITESGAAIVSEGSSYVSAQSTRTTNAFTMYVVGGATTSVLTFQRWGSSMSITSTEGLYAGTTVFLYADADKDTVGEFITYLNAVPDTTLGAEGGIVAVINAKCYESNLTSEITVSTTAKNCHSSTHTVTVGLDRVLAIIEKLDVPASKKQYFVTDCKVNVTFATGSTYLYIRDGLEDDSTLKYRQQISTSTEDKLMDASLVVGSKDTAIRFEVLGSTWISAGDFFYTIYQQ